MVVNPVFERDMQWIEALEASLGRYVRGIALVDDPAKFVDACLNPLKQRLKEESELAVRLRDKLYEVAGADVASSVV